MSGISVQGEQSTSSEITALANLTALSTSSAGQFLRKTGLITFENSTPAEAGLGDALTTNPLSQFAATTSLQLLGVISDETGSGSLVFGTAPTFATSITGSYLTASEILITDASKNIVSAAVATYPSLTELSYVKGVTSALQTQIDAKAPSASPTFTGTVILPKTLEIQDTSADHQYILAVSELAADRTITLPLLAGADEFVFKDHIQTLTNKTLTSPTLTTPALGTPASGVLTNCTGLPAASVLAGSFGAGAFVISTSLQVATLELGHATDTTLSRVSAGVIAVEGVTIADISSTQTFSSKRITQRVVTAADDATAVIDVDITDQYQLTAMANATTISTTGTPTAGQKLAIRLKDNGTGRALTWDAVFRAIGVTLPTTTVASKTHYIGCIYNLTDTKWDAVAVGAEA